MDRIEAARLAGEPFYRTPGVSNAERDFVISQIKERGYRAHVDQFKTVRVFFFKP